MKTLFKISALALMISVGVMSCADDALNPGLEDFNSIEAKTIGGGSTIGSVVYPLSTYPFGKSYEQWSKEWMKYILSRPCATNPVNDQTGANALVGQTGPVVFLADVVDGTVKRQITISRDKAIFFPIVYNLASYPCIDADADFQPKPGQTLHDFLVEAAKLGIEVGDRLSVSLDGAQVPRPKDFRVTTSIFRFTGKEDLADCFNTCITGKPQDAVTDGYWIMLKKLAKGNHILRFQGEIPALNRKVDVIYDIRVI